MKVATTVALAVCCALLSAGARANFVNSGFETGDATGWTVGGGYGAFGVATDGTLVPEGDFQPAFVNVRSGSFAAFGATATSLGEFYSLSQTVDLEAGTHTVGFFLGHDDNTLIGIDNAILDQRLAILVDGAVLDFSIRYPGNDFPKGSTSADMFEFAADFVSAGGPALIEFRISGSGTGRTVLSADDFYVTGVPEPGTVALMLAGLGLVACVAGRRKA